MSKTRILIVDDEVTFTRLVKLNLEQSGNYEVIIENIPDRAIETAEKEKPDFLFLDIIMPEKDGGEIAMKIREHPQLKKLPIVFLTATVAKQEVDARNGVIGGFPFIAKPAKTQDLINAIENQLKKVR